MEDIISCANGVLCIQVWQADDHNVLLDEDFMVHIDGITQNVR